MELSLVSEKRPPSASVGGAMTVDRVSALQVEGGRHWRVVGGNIYRSLSGVIPH
jgi:hypothetical protein